MRKTFWQEPAISREQLINLRTLARVVGLDQLRGKLLLLLLADLHQLAVQIEQRLQIFSQLTLIPGGLDHGGLNGLSALMIQLSDYRPIVTLQGFTQGATGRLQKLN